MTEAMLDIIKKEYPLEKIDAGEFAQMKVSGMKFNICAYHAKGLGHVSVMTAKGFFGLMKMDTLIIVPQEKDLPLYSYDRIKAMGNDKLYLELYNTLTGDFTSSLDEVKSKYSSLPDFDPGKHWYDNIKMPQSVFKTGKKMGNTFDELVIDYLKAYLDAGKNSSATFDTSVKDQKSQAYVNGLIKNGGPSTDVFKKAIGEEKTAMLFKKVLFGTQV
jgi:hypothetical protein